MLCAIILVPHNSSAADSSDPAPDSLDSTTATAPTDSAEAAIITTSTAIPGGETDSSGLSDGAIAGISMGALAGAAALLGGGGAAIKAFNKRRAAKTSQDEPDASVSTLGESLSGSSVDGDASEKRKLALKKAALMARIAARFRRTGTSNTDPSDAPGSTAVISDDATPREPTRTLKQPETQTSLNQEYVGTTARFAVTDSLALEAPQPVSTAKTTPKSFIERARTAASRTATATKALFARKPLPSAPNASAPAAAEAEPSSPRPSASFAAASNPDITQEPMTPAGTATAPISAATGPKTSFDSNLAAIEKELAKLEKIPLAQTPTALAKKLGELAAERSTLSSRFEGARTQEIRLTSEVATHAANLNRLRNTSGTTGAQIADQVAKHNAAIASRSAAATEFNTLNQTIEAINAKQLKVERQLAQEVASRTTQSKQKTQRQDVLGQRKEKLVAAREQEIQLQDPIITAEARITALKATKQALKKSSATTTQDTTEEDAEITRLQKELADHKQKLAQHRQAVSVELQGIDAAYAANGGGIGIKAKVRAREIFSAARKAGSDFAKTAQKMAREMSPFKRKSAATVTPAPPTQTASTGAKSQTSPEPQQATPHSLTPRLSVPIELARYPSSEAPNSSRIEDTLAAPQPSAPIAASRLYNIGSATGTSEEESPPTTAPSRPALFEPQSPSATVPIASTTTAASPRATTAATEAAESRVAAQEAALSALPMVNPSTPAPTTTEPVTPTARSAVDVESELNAARAQISKEATLAGAAKLFTQTPTTQNMNEFLVASEAAKNKASFDIQSLSTPRASLTRTARNENIAEQGNVVRNFLREHERLIEKAAKLQAEYQQLNPITAAASAPMRAPEESGAPAPSFTAIKGGLSVYRNSTDSAAPKASRNGRTDLTIDASPSGLAPVQLHHGAPTPNARDILHPQEGVIVAPVPLLRRDSLRSATARTSPHNLQGSQTQRSKEAEDLSHKGALRRSTQTRTPRASRT